MKINFRNLNLYKTWNKFQLADKFLLIIMAILMIQTAHNLFFHEIVMQDSDALDVVIRTTTAAIFGYFMSSNFRTGNKTLYNIHQPTAVAIASPPSSSTSTKTNSDTRSSFNSSPKSKIGFNPDAALPETEDIHTQWSNNNQYETDNPVQIIVVATIGIISLIFILFARNCGSMNSEAVATLSQLRDFISGSVGFLIGLSTKKRK